MDINQEVRLETYPADEHWEGDDRRDIVEGLRSKRHPSSGEISEDLGDYEGPWDDFRRRERMAEACYEC